jgi:hypothetical protein
LFYKLQEKTMTQLAISRIEEIEKRNLSDWVRLCRLGGVAAWLQFLSLVAMMIIIPLVGGTPESIEATYVMLQEDGLAGILRLDIATIILLALFPVLTVGLYAALRQGRQAYALLAMVLILTGTLLSLANESAFSMIYLSDQYAAATTAVQQKQVIAAGEAVMAGNMWHSSAGFLAGIFMQGGFVFISLVMLRSNGFSKVTAYSGILSNGLDLIHVPLALFAPDPAAIILGIGGIFYLVWFPLLGRDLYKIGRDGSA